MDRKSRLPGIPPPEQLREDFAQLRSALENNHPDGLRFESAAAEENGRSDWAFALRSGFAAP
jgi:hypothetical protein